MILHSKSFGIFSPIHVLLLFASSILAQQRVPEDKTSLADSWPKPNLQKIKSDIKSLVMNEAGASRLFTELDWSQSTNLHSKVIRMLQEIPATQAMLEAFRMNPNQKAFGLVNKKTHAVLRLEVAMILTKKGLLDEALDYLNDLDLPSVPEPAIAELYKAICLHKTVQIDEAKRLVEKLTTHRDELPTRYQRIVDSLSADLSKHDLDPLHTVARLMADAGRRQNLTQQSDKVLQQETKIIKKLDELIKKLEEEKKKMSQASTSDSKPANGSSESSPSDAKPSGSGSQGKGEVQSRDQNSDGSWGSLSNSEKAIAVKSLVRQLPPHFQNLMKAYLQKLAEESKQQ